jgi:hypothetical protein
MISKRKRPPKLLIMLFWPLAAIMWLLGFALLVVGLEKRDRQKKKAKAN